ncbi:signal recognition particle-docking protein FtsY [Gammaproteobacteria bacterium AH-315-C21]|nr:signal recognition particle-docking protein FtsY [Gammaproteobacteria bacterium AH-315-C21]
MVFGFKNKRVDSAPPDNMKDKDGENNAADKSEKKGLWGRLKSGLSRTREGLTDGLATLVAGKKKIDGEVLDELEMRLLSADIGVELTMEIIESLQARLKRNQLDDVDQLLAALREELLASLAPVSKPLELYNAKPWVLLMIGVNGVGKTTTIGKLAKQFQLDGKRVMLSAGDTFRAAAVEQLQVWGERNDIPVIAHGQDADPAAVSFDAINATKARDIDVLLADTAGRLHTKSNLIVELQKIKRIMARELPGAPHETWIVIDATTGQNGLVQAQQFNKAVGVTGVVLTKLDGTAKGGITFAIAHKLGIPIRYIGVGESIDDLREFNAEEFVDSLLAVE